MEDQRHDRLSELFERAVGLSPDARGRFIEVCSDDPMIRAELRSLLAAHLLERLAGEVLPAALQAVAEDDAVTQRADGRAHPLGSTDAHAKSPATALEPGTHLESYEIQCRIAAGGIGIVYRAFDTALQRPVAIKILAWSSPDARELLLREARAASALNHPRICTIYEVSEHEGIPFIAMEYIEGRPLREVIPSEGLPAEQVVRYGTQIAEAVEYAHRHGIIHRDLKSANVMISAESQAKVLDFGLASRIPAADMETLTRSHVLEPAWEPLAGTLAYLAPELLRGGVANKRSDVWALGVLFYEMAAGTLPFWGSTPFDLTAAILDGSPAPLPTKLPMPVRAVIARCLARDPAQRYQHAGEVRVALETLQLGSDPAVSHDEMPAARAALPPPWRRRGTVIAAAAIAMLAVAALVVRSRTTRALALTERDTLLVADFVNTTGESVFDGTLRQALSIHLEQSPFLRIVSGEEVRDTLRLMTKSADDRLVGDVAREACQRVGAKAMIEGRIAPVGSHYAIGLQTLDCHSAKTVASEQAEAVGREDVLKALSAAASRLRRKLGESLPTLQRFDTPIDQATTASLEALKAFSAGEEIRGRRSELGAVPFYKHAIELDSNFALAYARLSSIYGNVGQFAEMRHNTDEAYARRDRVTERERLYIDGRHCAATAEPDCFINVNELWKGTYPRDGRPHGNLSSAYYNRGECKKALENAVAAVRIDPAHSQPYAYLAQAYLCSGRAAEARQTVEQALARHLEGPFLYIVLFRSAFFERDERTMATVRHWARGQPEEAVFAALESDAAAFDGRMRLSREARLRAEQLAAGDLNERAASIRAAGALYEAAQGDFHRASSIIASMRADPSPASTIQFLAAARVLAHDFRRADALLHPRASAGTDVLVPLVRVLRDVDNGDRSAVQRLPPPSPDFRPGETFSFSPVYIRGLVHLHAGDGVQAAAEFQRILDHRSLAPTSPLYPLAYVQQARAYALNGDQAKARKAYQDFFALWKDADPDIPILREAKTEYARLSGPGDTGRH
jgi:eukaryotic-like serine/threonine-protein kinase